MQKSVEFVYINNEGSKREIKQTIPFKIAQKNTQEKNLTEEVKDLCTENYKKSTKETDKDMNK